MDLNFVSDVELPSGGKFYAEGSPWHGVTHVPMRHPTTKEQEMLVDQDLIKKDKALDRVLESLLDDPEHKRAYGQLLLLDQSGLIVAMRSLMHGSLYRAMTYCEFCGTKQRVTVDLDEIGIRHPDEEVAKKLGVVTENNHEHGKVFTVPTKYASSTFDIKFRLLTISDQEKLRTAKFAAEKNGLEWSSTQASLRKEIIAINGDSDPGMISEFVMKAPTILIKSYAKARDAVSPSVPLEIDFKCKGCGAEERGWEVALGAEFFWPKS